MRDMSYRQLLAALERRGLKPVGFMGYVECPLSDGTKVSISRWNGGPRRRDQLAYILHQIDRHERAIETRKETSR